MKVLFLLSLAQYTRHLLSGFCGTYRNSRSKRGVIPESDTGGEVENDARFEIACVHSERENRLRHQYRKRSRAKNCVRQRQKYASLTA